MDELAKQWPSLAWQLAAGLAALVLCRSRLRPGAFADAPRREAGLQPAHLFIGLFIMLFGRAMIAVVIPSLGLPMPGGEAPVSPRQHAIISIVAQLLGMLPVVIYLLSLTHGDGGWRKLGAIPRNPPRELWSGLLGAAAGLSFALGVGAIALALSMLVGQKPPAIGHEMLRQMMDTPDAVAIALFAASAVILAPVLEEFIFRGLVQTTLQEATGWTMRWPIVILSAALFAAIHIGAVPWQALPSLFVLGIVLGWLYERHGSLLPSILVHRLFNIANIIMAMLMQNPPAP